MGQDLDKIARVYDAVAKEYALAFAGEHEKKPLDRHMLARFARLLEGRGPVWDLGCGPGQTTKYLHGLGLETAGLDLSEKILEQARSSHPGLEFRRGNILELEFESGSIAGIVAFYALVHFTAQQVERALKEMFRVLGPGGIMLLTFHVGERTLRVREFLGQEIDIDFMMFSPDFISRRLKECGFAQIEVTEREPYPGVEYPSRRAYALAVKPADHRP